jgi:hypothetical protein
MVNLAQLTEADFEKMAQEIQEISETQTEDSLLETIGNALHDSGLTVSTANSFEILQPKAFSEATEKFSMKRSFSFVSDTTPMSTNEAKEEGRKFWQRFKDKLRSAICNDSKIKELLEGDGTLKDYLIAGIPLILAALGIGALNPLALAIVAAVVALIVKVGFQAYCEMA